MTTATVEQTATTPSCTALTRRERLLEAALHFWNDGIHPTREQLIEFADLRGYDHELFKSVVEKVGGEWTYPDGRGKGRKSVLSPLPE